MPRPRLTPRQIEVLERLMRGESYDAIAEALSLSRPTVQSHVSAVLAAHGAASSIELVCRLWSRRCAKLERELRQLRSA